MWRWGSQRWGEEGTFLGNLRGRAPVIDPSFGDARLAAMRTTVRDGGPEQWATLRSTLATARGPEDLTFLIEGLMDVYGSERWMDDMVTDQPDDPLALLVSGAWYVGWAWRARGRSGGSTVSEEQRERFRERLLIAEERLRDVAEREPDWAAPWYFLQMCGRGLQVGPSAAEHRFEAVCRRAPGHLGAHRQHLQQVSEKWGGSHEQMFSFAREAARTAPDGSGLGQLVPMAHLEMWLDASGDQDSVVLHDPEVVRELHVSAARSVHHPAFVRERDWAVGVNTFAMAFSLAGEKAAARVMFRSVGRHVTETPWQYMDGRSPVLSFLTWRKRVGA